METIDLAGCGRRTTRLGFGCSSLMGALGRHESLSLLEAAYEAGIRHFDVAPMYGFGAAEGCLGEFLVRHTGELTVTTKYGIPPSKHQGLLGMARRIAGPVARMLPGMKQRLSRIAGRVAGAGSRASFSAQEAQDSLHRSLRELRTERIDVWLLHEVETGDLQDDGLLHFLEESRAAGKIGSFGIGSSREKASALLAGAPAYCQVLQFEWSVLDAMLPLSEPFRIHHRALTDHFRQLHAELSGDASRCKRWSEIVGADLSRREVLAGLMLKASLILNPASVVLFSSKDTAHIALNAGHADDETMVGPAGRLYELVQGLQGI